MLDQARDTAKEIAGDLLGNKNIEELSIEIGYEGEDFPSATIENHDGEEVLVLNLDKVEGSKEERILSAASSDVWMEQGGLFDSRINEDVLLVKEAITRDDIKSIVGFFEDYLSNREINLLRRCLYLRLEWEDEETYTDSRHMTDRKSDLRQEYGNKATTVANLSSSGYYDENGFIREVFNRIEQDQTLGPADYERVYNRILQDEPFCVFVSGHDRIYRIKEDVTSKLNASDKYSIDMDFVDVRGQGGENRSKLEQAVLELQRDANTMHFEAWVRPRETAYRIYVDSTELE